MDDTQKPPKKFYTGKRLTERGPIEWAGRGVYALGVGNVWIKVTNMNLVETAAELGCQFTFVYPFQVTDEEPK